ncbi:hypothetical protein Acidovoranil_32030 [Acidovorax sp. FG27]
MGTGERSMLETASRRWAGQPPMGPSGVAAQSNPAIRDAIGPPPRRKGGSSGAGGGNVDGRRSMHGMAVDSDGRMAGCGPFR